MSMKSLHMIIKVCLSPCRILEYFQTSSDEYSVIFTGGCTDALKIISHNFDFEGFSGLKTDQKTSQSSHNTADQLSCTNTADSELGVDGNNGVNTQITKVFEGSKGAFCYLDDNHTSVVGMREICAERGASVYCVSKGHFENGKTTDLKRDIQGNVLYAYPAQSNFSGGKYQLKWIENLRGTKCSDNKAKCQVRSPHHTSEYNETLESNYKTETNGKDVDISVTSKQREGGTERNNVYVLLDTAALLCTSPLDLSQYKPDFVTVSFYKMFGFPTGLGK